MLQRYALNNLVLKYNLIMEFLLYIVIAVIFGTVIFLAMRSVNEGMKARSELKRDGTLDKNREDQYKFELDTARVILPQEWQNKDDPLYWITAQWTMAIEQLIRKDPEQYWWIHRRWKTRPPEELKAT